MPEYAGFSISNNFDYTECCAAGQALVKGQIMKGITECRDNDNNDHPVTCKIESGSAFCRLALGGYGRDITEYKALAGCAGRQNCVEFLPGMTKVRCQIKAKEYMHAMISDFQDNYKRMLQLKTVDWTTSMRMFRRYLTVPAQYELNGKMVTNDTHLEEHEEGLTPEHQAMITGVLRGVDDACAGDPILRLRISAVITNAFGYKLTKYQKKELRRTAKEHYEAEAERVKQEELDKKRMAGKGVKEEHGISSDQDPDDVNVVKSSDLDSSSDDDWDNEDFGKSSVKTERTTGSWLKAPGASAKMAPKREKKMKKEKKEH